MERNFKINPIGLKGNEINERMKQLMGMTPMNEGLSRSTVELTKIGPDGKTYGIVRENHEYYIKVSDKTSNLTVEDFKYIGGLQNKKQEAYPSYAKATKHLNLKFNSICESYDIVNTFNVFVDDKLLSEHHPYKADQALSATKGMGDGQEYVVDKAGKALSADAKEEGGDNLAGKKVMDEMEEVTLTEDELAIDAMLNEMEELEEEESKDNPWAICTASVGRKDKEKYEACVRDVKKEKGIKENFGVEPEQEPTTDELMDRLDNMSAAEFIELLGDAGKDVMQFAKRKIEAGTKFMLNKMGHEVDEAKDFPDLTGPKGKPDGKVTRADILKGRGVDLDEEMTIEEIQEAIADLKKKL
jgi:hypothetical protein